MASNASHIEGDDGDEAEASIRALRPRSSRRGSWDSLESRWSARVGGGGVGTPSIASAVTRAASIGPHSIVTRRTSLGKLRLLGVTDEVEGRSMDERTAAAPSVETLEHHPVDEGTTLDIAVPSIAVEVSTPPAFQKSHSDAMDHSK